MKIATRAEFFNTHRPNHSSTDSDHSSRSSETKLFHVKFRGYNPRDMKMPPRFILTSEGKPSNLKTGQMTIVWEAFR